MKAGFVPSPLTTFKLPLPVPVLRKMAVLPAGLVSRFDPVPFPP